MTTTTSDDKQQTYQALNLAGNLRQAFRDHMEERSSQGWSGSSRTREKLARVASRFQQAVFAEGWHDPAPALDHSIRHLMGWVEVFADAEKKFVSDTASGTLDKIEDLEQALRSRLDDSPLRFPITASELARRAGLRDVGSVRDQMDNVIKKDREQRGKPPLASRKRGRGQAPSYSEAEVALYPQLNPGGLKEYLAAAHENK